MPGSEGWAIKFQSREAFGRFCVALREDGRSFTLAGSQTVILPKKETGFVKAGEKVTETLALLGEFRKTGIVKEYAVPGRGKRRRLPTSDETKALLKRFTQELDERKYMSED